VNRMALHHQIQDLIRNGLTITNCWSGWLSHAPFISRAPVAGQALTIKSLGAKYFRTPTDFKFKKNFWRLRKSFFGVRVEKCGRVAGLFWGGGEPRVPFYPKPAQKAHGF